MHVRISEVGKKILTDRKLSSKVADAIIGGKEQLRNGIPVNVMNGGKVIG